MDESAVAKLPGVAWPADGMHRRNDVSVADVKAMLEAGRPVIANVLKGACALVHTPHAR